MNNFWLELLEDLAREIADRHIEEEGITDIFEMADVYRLARQYVREYPTGTKGMNDGSNRRQCSV